MAPHIAAPVIGRRVRADPLAHAGYLWQDDRRTDALTPLREIIMKRIREFLRDCTCRKLRL
jgi:hypothetical protein